ncbi:MAG: (d)CMP kinase [Actinomycetes bacterium]
MAASTHGLVVAIDGPSGAGKSTVARMLAQRLGADYLDTGAMYRAVTLYALEQGTDLEDAAAVAALANRLEFRPLLDPARPALLVEGRDVSAEVRSEPVTRAVSVVSAVPGVRARLVKVQQAALASADAIVIEGRDIGTVVAPDADVKIFLTADASSRASRRNLELTSSKATVEETAADLARRDELDSGRSVSPLQPAADAVEIDTTDLTAEQAVDEILSVIRARTTEGGA